MSILIKESEEASGNAEILYNNPLVNAYRNFYNELYIIKSYPLVEEVIDKLNFASVISVEGNIKETELYKSVPINFKLLSLSSDAVFNFNLEILKNNKFKIETISDGKYNGKSYVFSYPDTISFCGIKFYASPTERGIINKFYNKPYKLRIIGKNSLVKSYVNKLSVNWAEEGSSVVNLTINGTIPEKEIDFLNTLISTYAQKDLEKKRVAATRSLDFIESQLHDIADSLLLYEIQLENFKNKNILTNLDGEAKRIFLKVESLEQDKTAIVIHNNYLDYLKKYIIESENLDQVILPASVGVDDHILIELVSKMVDLQLGLKSYLHLETNNNPLYQEKINSLNNIRNSVLESVKNLKNTNRIQTNIIDKQIDVLNTQIRKLPSAERKLITIKRNYKFSENLHNFLTQKRAEAGITKASAVSDILVVNPAMQSGGAILPNTNRNYIIALVIGVGVPFIFLLLSEYFNNKIQSKEDIEKIIDIPISGLVGHNKSQEELVVQNSSKSAVSESFRALRSNLLFFVNKKKKKTFMITSSISGEGKSFVCMNLGTVMALSGKNTIIIGADMRKPNKFSEFKIGNEMGLSNVLSGKTPLNDVIQKTQVDKLSLISAGHIPPNPSELLMQDNLGEIVTELQQKYDNIIIDTPPIALVTDAFVISRLVDHTIYITRQDFTPLVAIRNVAELYRNDKIKNLSVVINDIKNNRPGYGYGYSYGYGYKYGYYEKGYYEEQT